MSNGLSVSLEKDKLNLAHLVLYWLLFFALSHCFLMSTCWLHGRVIPTPLMPIEVPFTSVT